VALLPVLVVGTQVMVEVLAVLGLLPQLLMVQVVVLVDTQVLVVLVPIMDRLMVAVEL